jgi:hypothetical protein
MRISLGPSRRPTSLSLRRGLLVIWGCFVKLRNDSLAGIGRLALEAASNEAFAPQVLGCLKLMDIPFDDSRVNPTVGP